MVSQVGLAFGKITFVTEIMATPRMNLEKRHFVLEGDGVALVGVSFEGAASSMQEDDVLNRNVVMTSMHAKVGSLHTSRRFLSII